MSNRKISKIVLCFLVDFEGSPDFGHATGKLKACKLDLDNTFVEWTVEKDNRTLIEKDLTESGLKPFLRFVWVFLAYHMEKEYGEKLTKLKSAVTELKRKDGNGNPPMRKLFDETYGQSIFPPLVHFDALNPRRSCFDKPSFPSSAIEVMYRTYSRIAIKATEEVATKILHEIDPNTGEFFCNSTAKTNEQDLTKDGKPRTGVGKKGKKRANKLVGDEVLSGVISQASKGCNPDLPKPVSEDIVPSGVAKGDTSLDADEIQELLSENLVETDSLSTKQATPELPNNKGDDEPLNRVGCNLDLPGTVHEDQGASEVADSDSFGQEPMETQSTHTNTLATEPTPNAGKSTIIGQHSFTSKVEMVTLATIAGTIAIGFALLRGTKTVEGIPESTQSASPSTHHVTLRMLQLASEQEFRQGRILAPFVVKKLEIQHPFTSGLGDAKRDAFIAENIGEFGHRTFYSETPLPLNGSVSSFKFAYGNVDTIVILYVALKDGSQIYSGWNDPVRSQVIELNTEIKNAGIYYLAAILVPTDSEDVILKERPNLEISWEDR